MAPPMTVLHVGCTSERAPGPRYVRTLDFVELAPRAPLPRKGTLARMRKEMPDALAIALVAPRAALTSARGALRPDPGLDEAVTWTLEAHDMLRARLLVVPTPPDLTTGARDRDLLAAYVTRLGARSGRPIVWAPGGLWEPDVAARFAAKIGVVCAFDPLQAPAPRGAIAYARLQALGARQRFSEALLERVLVAILSDGIEEAYVAIESPMSFKEATALRALAGALTGAGAGDATTDDDDSDDDDDEDSDGDGDDSDDDDSGGDDDDDDDDADADDDE